MEQKDNSHKAWALGKKPSMKRRCEENNYTERGLYMVTLAIEGRQPLLGKLEGNADINEGPDSPHVVPTPFGERVKACWLATQQQEELTASSGSPTTTTASCSEKASYNAGYPISTTTLVASC